MCPFAQTHVIRTLFCPSNAPSPKKVLYVNTQACAVAIARFDPAPIMQETPESEKQNAGTDRNSGNVNMFDFQDEARFEIAAHWYKFNGYDK
jgi:hypothetical protein